MITFSISKYCVYIFTKSEITASVLLKLFIDGNARCHTIDVRGAKRNSIFNQKQHTIHDPRGPEQILLHTFHVIRGDLFEPSHLTNSARKCCGHNFCQCDYSIGFQGF